MQTKKPFVLYLRICTLVYIIENIFSVESKVNIFQLESTFYLISCQISVLAACKCYHFGNERVAGEKWVGSSHKVQEWGGKIFLAKDCKAKPFFVAESSMTSFMAT